MLDGLLPRFMHSVGKSLCNKSMMSLHRSIVLLPCPALISVHSGIQSVLCKPDKVALYQISPHFISVDAVRQANNGCLNFKAFSLVLK